MKIFVIAKSTIINMSGDSKLDNLKKLFSVKDSVDPLVNEAYKKRVNDSNNLIENFNFQAEELIKQIERDTSVDATELEPEFQEIEEKRKAIALYRSYEKILFFSDKTDIIGESTTSMTLNKLINEQITTHRHLKAQNEKLSNDLIELEFHHLDYANLLDELSYLKLSKQKEVEELKQKLDTSLENTLIKELTSQLSSKINDSGNFLSILDKLLDKIVLKYADFSNIAVESNNDLEEVKDFLYKLIEDSVKGTYTNINELDKYQRVIIDNLVISNIIEVQSDGTSSNANNLVKLRNFV